MTSTLSLPEELRRRVLAASLAARDPGLATPSPEPITAAEAFARTAASLLELVAALNDDQWRVRALRDLDVQGLVGHLVGVEHDVQRALAGDIDVADVDHVQSTAAAVRIASAQQPAQTCATLRAAVDRTMQLLGGVTDETVLCMHGMRLSCHDLLVVRAFELWTHENDVRRALALAPTAPDASTLALMTELAVRLLPHAARRTGLPAAAVELRLVLTGAGGGTWDLPLGPPSDAPAGLLVVSDAVDFCRVVAARLAPVELDVHVVGDREHANGMLAAAASLALD